MKIHPIIMSPSQLMTELEDRRFFLPLRIEIPIPDTAPWRDDNDLLTECSTRLSSCNYVIGRHRNEAAREDVYTATQRSPILHLLDATREGFASRRIVPSPAPLYREMGLAEEEVRIAFYEIYHHVRDEQNHRDLLRLSDDRFPSSWRIPRYEWCRAVARPHRPSPSVQEWANTTLGQPFAADERARQARPFRVIDRHDADALAVTQYQMAALGTSADAASTNLRRLLAGLVSETENQTGIPRETGARPTPVPAPKPAARTPACLIDAMCRRGRFIQPPPPRETGA